MKKLINLRKIASVMHTWIVLVSTVFLLLCIPFTLAGESYDVDFSVEQTQVVFLYEDDEVRFSLLGGEHVVIIEDVGTSSVKLDIGPYIDTKTELYPGLIGLDYILKLDLDKDGVTDMNLALYAITADQEVHLVLQDVISQGDVTGDVGLVDQEKTSSVSSKMWVLVGIGIALFGLVAFFLFHGGVFRKEEAIEGKEETSGETPGAILSSSSGNDSEQKEESL